VRYPPRQAPPPAPYEQGGYPPEHGGYPEQGYQEPGYASQGVDGQGSDQGQPQWEGGPYPVDPASYEQQQAGAYGDGYGYVPQQPGYDPYAPAGHDDQTAYGVPPDYAQGYGPEQPGYGGEPGYPPEQGYANPEQAYVDEQGYVDPAVYVDPAAYYPEGDQRRDGSEHQ